MKDDSLDPLDFVIKTLVNHEKVIDKMVSDLESITQQLGEAKELTRRLENIDNKLLVIKTELYNLDKYSTMRSNRLPLITEKKDLESGNIINLCEIIKPRVIIQCRQWKDFLVFAFQSEMISYTITEQEEIFQVTAFKANETVTYIGHLPKFALLMKTWLGFQLGVTENSILEGITTLS